MSSLRVAAQAIEEHQAASVCIERIVIGAVDLVEVGYALQRLGNPGLIAILLRLYSGRTAAEITAFDAKAAFDKLGLSGALSAQRSNGLASMVARIRRDAELAAA